MIEAFISKLMISSNRLKNILILLFLNLNLNYKRNKAQNYKKNKVLSWYNHQLKEKNKIGTHEMYHLIDMSNYKIN